MTVEGQASLIVSPFRGSLTLGWASGLIDGVNRGDFTGTKRATDRSFSLLDYRPSFVTKDPFISDSVRVASFGIGILDLFNDRFGWDHLAVRRDSTTFGLFSHGHYSISSQGGPNFDSQNSEVYNGLFRCKRTGSSTTFVVTICMFPRFAAT